MHRRFAAVAIGLLIAAGVEWWQYRPIDWWLRSYSSDAISVTPSQAYDVATRALSRFGGLPPDARLVQVWRLVRNSGALVKTTTQTVTFTVQNYDFVWMPNQVVSSDNDWIDVRVEGRPAQATYITRAWRPRWLRKILDASIREHATPIAAPDRVVSTCPGGAVNVDALRRVLGSMKPMPGETLERWEPNPHLYALMQEPGTVVASWRSLWRHSPFFNPPLPVDRMIVRDAWYQRWRHVDVEMPIEFVADKRLSKPSWTFFTSSDDEPVCVHPLPTPTPVPLD